MGAFLNFDFLVVLNLTVLLLYMAADNPHVGSNRNVLGAIVLGMAVIAVVADVFFLVLKFGH